MLSLSQMIYSNVLIKLYFSAYLIITKSAVHKPGDVMLCNVFSFPLCLILNIFSCFSAEDLK